MRVTGEQTAAKKIVENQVKIIYNKSRPIAKNDTQVNKEVTSHGRCSSW